MEVVPDYGQDVPGILEQAFGHTVDVVAIELRAPAIQDEFVQRREATKCSMAILSDLAILHQLTSHLRVIRIALDLAEICRMVTPKAACSGFLIAEPFSLLYR